MSGPQKPLSDSQLKALRYLESEAPQLVTPADVGYAMAEGKERQPRNGQGAGRTGGGMLSRLEKAGLACTKPYGEQGRWRRWTITAAGRAALPKEETNG